MTTQLTPPVATSTPAPRANRTARRFAMLAVVAAPVIAMLVSRTGPGAERIRNPNVTGAPRPVEFLFGFDHWIMLHQVGLILMMLTLVTGFVIGWRRHPGHPVLLMVLATTLLVWQDPIMNWAPYAVYNPELWHWPETWPLVSLSPTVEPFIVIGYATFYMAPFFPAVAVLRRIQAERPVESFVWRHPLLSLSALILVIGFVFDAFLEIFLVRTGLYIYSHVIPWGSFAAGEWYQFPLLWESVLVSTVMIPAGVLLYKDDTGRTQAEKLAQKLRLLRTRPMLGTFAVMFAVVNFTYFFLYGGGFALMKDTRAASSVACPWPYPETKVYDPQGFYEEAGEWYQFPLLWESVLVSTVMIPAGVLLYRDDTGRTQAEKLAQKLRFLRTRPMLGTFAVMFAVVNFTYFFLYGGGFALMKDTRAASSVACPWPYPETKVYDPQGFYEEAGQPGPYFPGIWSEWQSAQPDGRPDVEPPADGGRCGGD